MEAGSASYGRWYNLLSPITVFFVFMGLASRMSTTTVITEQVSKQVDCPLDNPFEADELLQVRTGKIKPLYDLPVTSAIYKNPRKGPVRVTTTGLEGDEQAYEKHGGPEMALLHYCTRHYDAWKADCPQSMHRFNVGGFGENLVSSTANERNICIGDIIQIGDEVQVQVSLPRQPCFKLNHRFEVKDMSRQAQEKSRTGWYYRVLRTGSIQAGDKIVLVKRLYPQRTIEAVQYYLHRDTRNIEAMQELLNLPELGEEIRTIFTNRLRKKYENQDDRLVGDDTMALNAWSKYKIAVKRRETQRIYSFTLEAIVPVEPDRKVQPGSHVRLKLGGKLMRAYSIIGGTSNRFELGIALDPNSRGGSRYLHETTKEGDVLSVSKIVSSFPLSAEADHHVLIAGGIGITAFLAAAEKLQESGESYILHLAVRNSNEVPFQRHLDKLGPNLVMHNKAIGETLNLSQIIARTNDNTHIYCCGPSRLGDGVASAAQSHGVPPGNVHFEAFQTATTGDPFTAELAHSNTTVAVDGDKTLLEALRDTGLDVPSSCESGSCGTCRVDVRKGRVEHRGTGLFESDKHFSMLSCVSRGIGHVVLEI